MLADLDHAPTKIRSTMMPLPLDVHTLWLETDQVENRFRKAVALRTQGDPVEFSSVGELAPALIAYEVVSRVSPVMSVCTRSGERVLVFDESDGRWACPKIIRREFIDVIENRPDRHASAPTHAIDFSTFGFTPTHEEELSWTETSLRRVDDLPEHIDHLSLSGETSILLALLFLRACHGRADTITYRDRTGRDYLVHDGTV